MIIVLISKYIYIDMYIYIFMNILFLKVIWEKLYIYYGRDNNFQDHFVKIDMFVDVSQ